MTKRRRQHRQHSADCCHCGCRTLRCSRRQRRSEDRHLRVRQSSPGSGRHGLDRFGGYPYRPFVDESASAAGCRDIGAVNRSVAVGAAIIQGQTGPVVMARMALQAQGWFTHRQQIRIRRAMRGVAIHAVFRHRRMLVRKGPAILRMAAETKVIHVRRAQVIARVPSVRIMAIGTGHFPFAQRVMIRHAQLRVLSLMAPQAGIVARRPGLDHGVRLR